MTKLRTCKHKGCSTILSKYNNDRYCWPHRVPDIDPEFGRADPCERCNGPIGPGKRPDHRRLCIQCRVKLEPDKYVRCPDCGKWVRRDKSGRLTCKRCSSERSRQKQRQAAIA